jgi:thiol-disulfide isomerase/thioredoxin
MSLPRTALTPLLLAALALTGCSTGSGSAVTGAGQQRYVAGDGTVTTYAVGSRRVVPAVTGTTLEGQPLDLTSPRGDVVVVNVWGSWCPPCRAEAPALERVWRATRADGVRFAGINVKDRPAAARAFVERFGVTYPSVDDSDGRAQLALRGVLPGAIPSTIVVDRAGRLAAAVFGGTDEPTLRRILRPLIAEGR